MTDLNARLLDAHARADLRALVALYTEAADVNTSDTAAGFYLTQAYVFALDSGHPETAHLRERLRAMGREA